MFVNADQNQEQTDIDIPKHNVSRRSFKFPNCDHTVAFTEPNMILHSEYTDITANDVKTRDRGHVVRLLRSEK